MTLTPSPLDPRVEVRHVGDRELEAMIEALVVPGMPFSPDWMGAFRADGVRRRIISEFGVAADPVRILEILLRRYPGARFSGHHFAGRLVEHLSGHQRMAITSARREDEAVAALPRPAPILALPAESLSAAIDRLLG